MSDPSVPQLRQWFEQAQAFAQDKWRSVLAPQQCVGCGYAGEWLCADCRLTVQRLPQPICPQCGYPQAHSLQHSACKFCRRYGQLLLNVRSYAFHEGCLRQAVLALKFKGKSNIAPFLGAWLASVLPAERPENAILVPVPLSEQRLKERGYNQAELLAKPVAARHRLPLQPDALRRVRTTQAQSRLTQFERQHNTAGAFVAQPAILAKRTVILVDDVCTTGATLTACAQACRLAGASAVWAITLTRAKNPWQEIQPQPPSEGALL